MNNDNKFCHYYEILFGFIVYNVENDMTFLIAIYRNDLRI